MEQFAKDTKKIEAAADSINRHNISEAALAVQILLEITDILLELEYFILEHLQMIQSVYK